ncbi:MAG: zinc ABC transporter substrate-binding protein [Gammaproteobacteria bacterium]|jgi:zinc/manganese transport system substrate-binding protein
MKRQILAVLFALFLLPQYVMAGLRVFSCEPEWASLVTELAGDHAEVFTATTAQQDPHYIQARPSLIAQMRRADLVVCTGAGLEAGWLPVLMARGGNPGIKPGTDGYFEAANFVPMLGVPQRLDRAEGDIHARGNPHIQLDPHNIERIAPVLSERLARLDPGNAGDYQQRLDDFSRRWQSARQRWEIQAASLRGMPIVVHHESWDYLNKWLGLNQVGTLEPKPGVPPSSSHLSGLLNTLKTRPARAVIRAPFEEARPSEWLGKRTDLVILELPFTVGGNEQASDLFGLFDSSIALLQEAQP